MQGFTEARREYVVSQASYRRRNVFAKEEKWLGEMLCRATVSLFEAGVPGVPGCLSA